MFIDFTVHDNKTGLTTSANVKIVKFYINKYGIQKFDVTRNENEKCLRVQEIDFYDDITVIKDFYLKPEEWVNRNRLLDKFEKNEMVIIANKGSFDNYVEV